MDENEESRPDNALNQTSPQDRKSKQNLRFSDETIQKCQDDDELIFKGLHILLIEKGIGPIQYDILKNQILHRGGILEKGISSRTTHIVTTSYAYALDHLKVNKLPPHAIVHSIAWVTENIKSGTRNMQSYLLSSSAIDTLNATSVQKEARALREVPKCHHHIACQAKCVKKEDKNEGRLFWCCGRKHNRYKPKASKEKDPNVRIRKELQKVQMILANIKPEKTPPKQDIKKSSPKKTPSPSLKEQRLKRKNSIQGTENAPRTSLQQNKTSSTTSESTPPAKKLRVEVTEIQNRQKDGSQGSASDTQKQEDNNMDINDSHTQHSPNTWLCYNSDDSMESSVSPLHLHQDVS